MLQVQNLWKSYDARQVVSDVSFNAEPGQIIGLLGPNGAGKTTTVAMICGLTAADKGSVLLSGQRIDGDRSAVKRKVGLVPQDIALFEGLSALGNLETFGALYGLKGVQLRERAVAALELVGLTDRARDKPATFSGGMKRRLNIACALVHDPDILLLDEPTVGIDPQSRNAIFENLETLKARGKTMVYTTHYMEEAERLCDRVAIVDHGRVIAQGSPRELIASLGAEHVVEFSTPDAPDTALDAPALQALDGVKAVRQQGGRWTLEVVDLAQTVPAVLAELRRRGLQLGELATHSATLEDVFMSLTGRQLRDD